ncbi:Synapse-associated protein 1 [Halotydeus destructor]|nr:Synapse-associated protein 1 [Halotydeus destructor]
MDYFNNILTKTGLNKKEEGAEESEGKDDLPSGEVNNEESAVSSNEGNATESGQSSERNGSIASSTMGFVTGMFKSPFTKSDKDGAERKASTTSEGDKTEGSEEKGSSNFVTSLLAKNPFKSESTKERKGSQTSTGSPTETGTEAMAAEDGEVISESGEGVSQKALDSAKSIGSFFYSVANKAGQTVTGAAKTIKHTVESNTLFSDFTKEQQDFMKDHGGHIEMGIAPWLGCENEEEMKEQVISLSQDKRNFVRNPPSKVQFDFDLQSSLPIALAILKEDENLSKMRFEIVPKLVNEETFWRNYFYRVSLLKQSTQANSVKGSKAWGSTDSSEAEGPDEITPSSEQAEFVSDSFAGDVSAEDLQKGMRQLGVSKKQDSKNEEADKDWEDELSKDLQEFEVVGGLNNSDEAELEKDLAAL